MPDYDEAFAEIPPPEPPDDWDARNVSAATPIAMAQSDRPADFDAQVAAQVYSLRVREAAARTFRSPQVAEPFDMGTLAEVMARPPEPQQRIDGLMPWSAAMLLTAQRKTGKTTLTLNLARSLLAGTPFLGAFDVRPVAGTVALLNFEVSSSQIARWADECGVDPDRLILVNLRGRRNPLHDEHERQRLADALRAHEVESLIVDPFGRAYTGTSQNDPGEVGAWLTDLDRFARSDVGALDLILTAHAGWNAERTRGSSALEDWADVIVTLTRDTTEDGDGQRYLRALGRDVEIDEDRLIFDEDTRTLTMAGTGSRKASRTADRADALVAAVVRVATANPGQSGSEIGRLLKEQGVPFQKGAERKALQAAIDRGLLQIDAGPRGAKLYNPSDLPRHPPTSPDGAGVDVPPPLYRGVCQPGEVESAPTPDHKLRSCGHPDMGTAGCRVCITEREAKAGSEAGTRSPRTPHCDYGIGCVGAVQADGFCQADDTAHRQARRFAQKVRPGDAQ